MTNRVVHKYDWKERGESCGRGANLVKQEKSQQGHGSPRVQYRFEVCQRSGWTDMTKHIISTTAATTTIIIALRPHSTHRLTT